MKGNTSTQQTHFPIVKTLNPIKDKMCISTSEGYIVIEKNLISHIKADGSYCVIVSDESKLTCSQTLGEITPRIRLNNFIRVHRSYFINLHKVQSFSSCLTSLTMENGTIIPIARSNKNLIKEKIELMYD